MNSGFRGIRFLSAALCIMWSAGLFSGWLEAQEREKTAIPEGRYPQLGVTYQMYKKGAVIRSVVKNSPAWKAGLEKGDRILRVDGFTIGVIDGNVFTLASEIRRARGTAILEVRSNRSREILEMKVDLEPTRP